MKVFTGPREARERRGTLTVSSEQAQKMVDALRRKKKQSLKC